jgi:gliding motility-associated-like protein
MITLIAISSDNCPDTAYQQIIFDNDPFYYVPNTFIPDGDGVNDIWNVVFSSPEDVKKYSMQIFDRWGELIFETKNIYQGWDGTYRNSQCQDGTYVWKLTFSWDDYRTFQKLGHVNLLR